MKKLALLLTVCLLAWSALAGCQTQETPQPPRAQRLRGFRQLHRPRGGPGGAVH